MPSYLEEDDQPDMFEGLEVSGSGVVLRVELALLPPVMRTRGTRHWMALYMVPPWSKRDRNEARLMAFDGLLEFLRSLRALLSTAAIAHGEACLVALMALSAEIRTAAFDARHIRDPERGELEGAAEALRFLILLAPHGFPVKTYMGWWRGFLPETACVAVSAEVQVVVVAPTGDAARDVAHAIGKQLVGSIATEAAFGGPAYRTVPSGLHLPELQPVPPNFEPVKPADGSATLVIEGFAGSANWSAEHLRVGFSARAYEAFPEGKGSEPISEGDLRREENQTEFLKSCREHTVFQNHVAPPCGSMSTMRARNGNTTRTMEHPEGDGSMQDEVDGNTLAAIAMWMVWTCLVYGVFVSLEHPRGSRLWQFPIMIFLLSLPAVYIVDYDSCAWGLRPTDWSPLDGDVRIQKAERLITTNPYHEIVRRRCSEVGPHQHQPLEGNDAFGNKRTTEAGKYLVSWCRALAHATRRAWLAGAKPAAAEFRNTTLPYVPLKLFLENVGASVAQLLAPAVQRPLTEGGASSSATPVVGTTKQDFWAETSTAWCRIHLQPRTNFFDPRELLESTALASSGAPSDLAGPVLEVLCGTRVTIQVSKNGNRRRTRDKFTEAHDSKGMRPWTGQTILYKVGADPPENTATTTSVPTTGEDVSPTSLTGALTVLRGEMAAAQRLDPSLAQVIAYLDKQKAGSYLDQPRRDLQKVRARAARYQLAEDGVLLGKPTDKESDALLPVVPSVKYSGDSRLPGAPAGTTWKHLLLASAHNISTAMHRNASEMALELGKLVMWEPPERLKTDCETWCARCKACVSVHRKPRAQPPLRPVLEHRPCHRVQTDLMEVKPEGVDGEKYVFTLIDVATRYVWLRTATNREASYLASLLLDIVLDIGIVFAIHQSDNEFCNAAFEEFVWLMGASQLFSTALRPQSNGVVERTHREIRSVLAVLLDALSRAAPRKWPAFVRWVEYRLRHKTLPNSHTAYEAMHGFAGSSALTSSLCALKEIPEELVHTDWLASVVAESKRISASLAEAMEQTAARASREQPERTRIASFKAGDIVLVEKPFYEKGTGMILPQMDGPFEVDRANTHACQLVDPLTRAPAFQGRPVASSRMVRFDFPADYLAEGSVPTPQVDSLRPGDMIVTARCQGKRSWVQVAKVDSIYEVGDQLGVMWYEVPQGQRFGPWRRRPWQPAPISGQPSDIIARSEVLLKVELQNDALTADALVTLASFGVATAEPTRDKVLHYT